MVALLVADNARSTLEEQSARLHQICATIASSHFNLHKKDASGDRH